MGLSAAQRRAKGCRRVDEPTSVRKFRVAPRASYAPLDRLPGSFRAGRSGWPKTQFGSTMGLFNSPNGISSQRAQRELRTEKEKEKERQLQIAAAAALPGN